MKEYAGRKVAIGLRPEHFTLGAEAAGGVAGVVFGGREITLVELLGSEMLVHFTTPAQPVVTEDMREAVDDADTFAALEAQAKRGGVEFVARLEPTRVPKLGEKVDLSFRTDKIHFFDIDEGNALR